MSIRKCKYLIIGAGVSGLSLANKLKSKDYLILEKNTETGGDCRTIKKDGFIWDYSGHFFHFSNNKIKNFFLNKISKKDLIFTKKITSIYIKSKLIDYPFQKNIHQLDKEDFIFCLYHLLKKDNINSKENNFLQMLYRNYGKGITDLFLKPYNEKLYSCNLNDLDKDAMGRFFPAANIDDIISNFILNNDDSYNSTFLYPKNGARVFIEALQKNINNKTILLNTNVININIKEKKVHTNNDTIYYDYLVNTIPFDKFLFLCNIKFLKKHFTYSKVLVFNIGFDKNSTNKEHWIYFPDLSYNFYRVGFYNNILNTNKMSLYVEISFKQDEDINVNDEFKKTLLSLKKCKIITNQKVISYTHVILNPAYIHVNNESYEIKQKYKKQFYFNNVFSIGRYGDWKYCSIEDNVIEAFNLSKYL
jgi:protoporphyrinogen oxidase